MFKVAALYKFYNTKNPIFIHKHIKSELSKFSVKGTLITLNLNLLIKKFYTDMNYKLTLNTLNFKYFLLIF